MKFRHKKLETSLYHTAQRCFDISNRLRVQLTSITDRQTDRTGVSNSAVWRPGVEIINSDQGVEEPSAQQLALVILVQPAVVSIDESLPVTRPTYIKP